MGLFSILGLVLLFLFAIWFLKRRFLSGNLPPEVPGAWPIIGHLGTLSSTKRHEQYMEWGRTVGPIFRMHLGPFVTTYIVTDFELIKIILQKEGEKFGHRPKTAFVTLGAELGIANTSGQIWKEQHNFSLSVLKSFGFGKSSLEHKIADEVSKLLEYFDEGIGKQESAVVDVNVPFKRCAANVIASIAMGRSYEKDDKEFDDLQEKLNRMFYLIASDEVNFLNLFPFLYLVPYFRKICKADELMELSNDFKAYMRKVIDEHKAELDLNKQPDDLVEAYLQALKKRQDAKEPMGSFSEDQLEAIINDLFAAGLDTVAETMRWMVLYMIHNPEVHEKCFKEISTVIGLNRTPTLEDRNNLPYLNAVIYETQRRSSVAESTLFHTSIENTTLGNYDIPANAVLIPFLHGVHMNSDYFPEPEKFKPEHFLDASGQLRKEEHFLPYGLGKRACMGENLARIELFLIAAAVMQRFQFRTPKGRATPTADAICGFAMVAQPYECEIVRR